MRPSRSAHAEIDPHSLASRRFRPGLLRPRGDRDALLRRADEVIEPPQEGRDCRVAALALPEHHSALHQFCQVSQAEETTQGWVDHVQSMPEFDPGCVKTPIGCSRTGIVFFWTRRPAAFAANPGFAIRNWGRSFYAFQMLQSFRTAKTPSGHLVYRQLRLRRPAACELSHAQPIPSVVD